MQAESQATPFPAGETERRDRPGLRWIRAVLPVGLGALAVLFFFYVYLERMLPANF